MSRRLLHRQSSSSMDVESATQDADNLNDRPIRQLWLRNDNKKKTSELNKTEEVSLPVVAEDLEASLTATQPATDILNLSPVVSTPNNLREQENDQDNTLLNQLQVRRSHPEHSPSDLSPNFYPSFTPEFVPQSRPRALLTYLQNFGHNNNPANQNPINVEQTRPTSQGDSSRNPLSFFSRLFSSNPPPRPQNNQISEENRSTLNLDEVAPTSTELTQFQPQQQSTNPANSLPHGVIIVRTVQPGPNGTMIVNMRVLPLGGLFNQPEGGSDNTEPGNSGIFGSLLGILASLQGVRMFSFGDLASFFDEERGLDKKIVEGLPLVIYDEEAFKHVDSESKKCTICLDQFENGNEIRYLWCLHRFHKDCVDRWLDKHTNCPVCKKDYSEIEEIPE